MASLKKCIVSGKVYTISGALLNCQSIVNKTQDLQVEIATNNYDLCALTETWIKEDDTLTSHRMCPPGYSVTSVLRTNHTGGGIAIVHKTGLSVTLINSDTTSSMEYAEFKIANHENDQKHNMILLYRPPNTNVLQFISDLTDILESLITKSGSITLLSNFNIKINEEDDYDSINFVDFLSAFGLQNRVTFPTHRLGNILDLILVEEGTNHITHTSMGDLFSDHRIVRFKLATSHISSGKKILKYCKLKTINEDNFANEISTKVKNDRKHQSTLSDDINTYNTILAETLDKHAPEIVREVTDRTKIPWYNDNIMEMKFAKEDAWSKYGRGKGMLIPILIFIIKGDWLTTC